MSGSNVSGSLAKMDPRPMSSTDVNLTNPNPEQQPPASSRAAPRAPYSPGPPPPLALNLPPESQIPDHPSSMMDVPRPSNNYGASVPYFPPPPTAPIGGGGGGGGGGYDGNSGLGYGTYYPGPSAAPMATSVFPTDIPSLKSRCQFQLQEYLSLQKKRLRTDPASTNYVDLESRIRAQRISVLGDLQSLQDEVRVMVKQAENHRWRKWFLGGAIASFVPLVRRIFRRGHDEESQLSSNDTEYAFKKSKGLIAHIKEGLLGKGRFAKIAFFVFAVLYVFQNEVSLRVAKTMQRRIKKLAARVDAGGEMDVDERDIKTLDGWRWRILLW